ncbi:MAG: M4 family metallopeptidase [Chitinophagaceae bacterium]
MRRILLNAQQFLLLIFIMSGASALAQKTPGQLQAIKQNVLNDKKVKVVALSEERQTPSFISMEVRNGIYSKDQARSALANYLQVRTGLDDLIQDRQTQLFGNIEVIEFQQYFRGVKVDLAKFKALVKDGQVQFFNGSWYNVPVSLSVQPRLDRGQALSYAKGRVNAKKYAWEEIEELKAKNIGNPAVLRALEKEKAEYDPKGELVIVQNFDKEGVAEVQLAYKFDIYAVEPLSRSWIYVSANDGNILLIDPIIKHANDPVPPGSVPTVSPVKTRYSGNQTIFTKWATADPNTGLPLVSSSTGLPLSGAFILADDTRGNGIETYDLNNVGGLPLSIGAVYAQGKSFTDEDNNWTLAEHKRSDLLQNGSGEGGALEANNDDIAWDAHWGAEVVYDYWLARHNRFSFDGKNGKIKSFIHYGPAYDNAFWNGSVMTYGDGSGPAAKGFKALTSLDVCGHEIGHGVCSYTANLVYAKESGAMNEGFSDIWAACVEYYAATVIAPQLKDSFAVFSIGEQIAANRSRPLRRMDNPQAEFDPDTYGGRYWKNPNCSPTLANDQCGVHTNSGVLNKWFYLLTVGSHTGSGPDVTFAVGDDGINDKSATEPNAGNTYSVTGLGFEKSEQIAYLTEIMLTTTATFAEARNVSISAANSLYGDPCGPEVKSVTNAWYGVGVGAEFIEPCKITYGFIYQPGSSASEGKAGAGCTAEFEVKIPVLMPAGSTGTVSVAGTATNNTDYRLSTTSLSNTGTISKVENISVFVKNDGVVENDETVELTITLTNVGENSLNNKYTLNIIEDDVVPVIGTESKSLLTGGDFNDQPDGFNSPSNWTEIIGKEGTGPTGENYNQWGVWGGKLMITGKLDAAGPVLPPGNYNDASPTTTIIKSPLIDARGLSTLNIKFDFRIQGEIDPNGIDPEEWGRYDYMAVVYSFDGVTFFELTLQEGFGQFASLQPKDGVFEGVLPSYLNNKTFYLGFKWFDDTNAGGPESVQIDNLILVGSPRQIENDLGHHSEERLRASQQVYYYSVEDGQIIGNIKNSSTKDFGCTNLSIANAGSGTSLLDLGNSGGKHTVADKVVKTVTEINNTKSSTTITLYFTEDQIKALETAAKTVRTKFYIYQIYAADYNLAIFTNTQKFAVTYTAIAGTGGSFSITVSNKLGGSFYRLGVPASSSGGGKKESFTTAEVNEVQYKWNIGNIYPNPAPGAAFVDITTPESKNIRVEYLNLTGQLVHVQQAQIAPGVNRIQLRLRSVSAGTYMIRFREANGALLGTKSFLKK